MYIKYISFTLENRVYLLIFISIYEPKLKQNLAHNYYYYYFLTLNSTQLNANIYYFLMRVYFSIKVSA